MSPKLKPLILPQLVEERRKQEMLQASIDPDATIVYYTHNSSSSDVASPVTPTFSTRGHLRYSSSSSSLELPLSCTDSPSSPTQVAHPKPLKSPLPDVQEEPTERDEELAAKPHSVSIYDCLCDEPCIHRDSSDMIQAAIAPEYDIDYDIGFLSDGDLSWEHGKKSRYEQESALSGIAMRFGSRFPTLTRWTSSRKFSYSTSPACELTFDTPQPVSDAPSSRSSSLSSPARPTLDRAAELPLPKSPAQSFWESSESVNLPAPLDIEKANGRRSIERDRALATTPLLPPLLTEALNQLPQPSPLQSPTVAPLSITPDLQPQPQPRSHNPTPSLSAKQSISSFRPSPTCLDLPIPFPNMLQDHDEWSDRLGHANFTILPQPYQPDTASVDGLEKLRADWHAARLNFTKHIVRTGENYGETSKIYKLTEAKWNEVDDSWRRIHDKTMERVLAISNAGQQNTSGSRSRSRGRGRGRSGSGSASVMGRPAVDDVFAGLQWKSLEGTVPSAIPRMLDAPGKFPSLGDEDIVGPMTRDAVMMRTRSEERKGPRFWKNLVGKVSLRK